MSVTETLIESITPVLAHVGYRIVFFLALFESTPLFGMLVPGLIVTMLGGFFAKLGILKLTLVYLLAATGAMIGDHISYALGRYYGKTLIKKFGKYILLSEEHYQTTEEIMKEHAYKAIILGRFSPITRALAPFVGGTVKIPLYKFTAATGIGATLWAGCFVTLGYLFGHTYETLAKYIDYGALILLCIILYLFIEAFRRKTRKKK
jgi:membrane protein DedA with SNARE-associated domain